MRASAARERPSSTHAGWTRPRWPPGRPPRPPRLAYRRLPSRSPPRRRPPTPPSPLAQPRSARTARSGQARLRPQHRATTSTPHVGRPRRVQRTHRGTRPARGTSRASGCARRRGTRPRDRDRPAWSERGAAAQRGCTEKAGSRGATLMRAGNSRADAGHAHGGDPRRVPSIRGLRRRQHDVRHRYGGQLAARRRGPAPPHSATSATAFSTGRPRDARHAGLTGTEQRSSSSCPTTPVAVGHRGRSCGARLVKRRSHHV